MWKFYRAWILWRIANCTPLAIRGYLSNPAWLPLCPACEVLIPDASHFLTSCGAMVGFRGKIKRPPVDWNKWAASWNNDLEVMRDKIDYVGLVFSSLVHMLQRSE